MLPKSATSGQGPPSTAPPATTHKPLSRQPMLWAASIYGAGIMTGFYVWRPPLWWRIAGIAYCASGA